MNDQTRDIAAAARHACIVAATVVAAAVLVFGAFADSGGGFWLLLLFLSGSAFVIALVIAALHLLIAIPLYLALSRRGPVPTGAAAACGFVIGVAPTILLYGPPRGGVPADWLGVLIVGVPGIAAGFAFGRDMNRHAD